MQLCDVEVRLGGNMLITRGPQAGRHRRPKFWSSADIHGNDAVVDIRPTKMDKRSHGAEWTRLDRHLWPRALRPSTMRRAVKLESLFPRRVKKLPVTLARSASSVRPERAVR
jgi:hypothetical protein